MITLADAHAYSRGTVTVEDIAIRENVTLETARKHLYDMLLPDKSRSRRKWSETDRQQLRQELTEAAQVRGAVTQAIRRWGLGSISHALGVLRIKSIDELRYGSRLNYILRPYKLRLSGDTLKAQGSRRTLALGADDLYRLTTAPLEWLKENAAIVRTLYPKKRKRGAK